MLGRETETKLKTKRGEQEKQRGALAKQIQTGKPKEADNTEREETRSEDRRWDVESAPKTKAEKEER